MNAKANEKKAAATLLQLVTSEHRYLTEAQPTDGFALGPIKSSEKNDPVFEAWFTLKLAGKDVEFMYSIHHEDDLYWAAVDVSGGEGTEPLEFERNFVSGRVELKALSETVEAFSPMLGEARFLAFQWLADCRKLAEIERLETDYCDAALSLRSAQVKLANYANELDEFLRARDALKAYKHFSGHLPETFFSGSDLDPDGTAPKTA